MMKKTLIAAVSLIGLASAFLFGTVFASTTQHSSTMDHATHNGATASLETGQAAFAAIAEIVRMLSDDADTDWSKVNIAALRDHLVDMNALMLGADVQVAESKNEIRFATTGDAKTRRALKAMVPAHARELNKMDQWGAKGLASGEGAQLVITASDKATLQRVRGLGFFGMMATGAHHQPHHFAIALGKSMH